MSHQNVFTSASDPTALVRDAGGCTLQGSPNSYEVRAAAKGTRVNAWYVQRWNWFMCF